jgi:hypothetical protein
MISSWRDTGVRRGAVQRVKVKNYGFCSVNDRASGVTAAKISAVGLREANRVLRQQRHLTARWHVMVRPLSLDKNAPTAPGIPHRHLAGGSGSSGDLLLWLDDQEALAIGAQ